MLSEAEENALALELLAQEAQELAVLMHDVDPDASEEIIEHYGVKGMRWGVRRDREDDISGMSDQDLRAVVNRMNLENNYRKMTKSSSTKAGETFFKKYQEHIFQALAVGAGAATVAAIKAGPGALRRAGQFVTDQAIRGGDSVVRDFIPR
jgi:hypothetical protein